MEHSEATLLERSVHACVDRPHLYIRIDAHIFRTIEWSYGGFVLEDETGALAPGALLRINGIAVEQAYRNARAPEVVDIRARVLRAMPEKGQVALTCLKLDDDAYRILRAIDDGTYTIAANQA